MAKNKRRRAAMTPGTGGTGQSPDGPSAAPGKPSASAKPPAEEFLRGRRAMRLAFLAALTIASLVPFLGKSFHIDDPLFLWAAKQVQVNPGNPYGFAVNWYGITLPMSEVTKNPPLTSYYIAAVAAVVGWSERSLHLAFLLPAIAAIIGTYLLAERMCRRPLLASLCTLFTPAFIVSSSNVMSDTLTVALWMAAIYLWVTGLERRSWILLTLSGLSIALCSFAKYFGMSLIPLLFLYSWLRERRIVWATAYLLVPVVLLGAYQWGTHELYGRGLLMDAASYATGARTGWSKWSFEKLLIGLGFTGGCLGAVWYFALRSWRPAALLGGAAAAVTVTVAVASAHMIGSHGLGEGEQNLWVTAGLLGVFVTGGLSVLAPAVLALKRLRDPDEVLLALWILGTFAFAAMVNWSTNARSILPLVPAAAIMTMRSLEHRRKAGWSARETIAGVCVAAVVALGVGWADLEYADSARQAAKVIHAKYQGHPRALWFEGHWGFQYYMEALGAKPIDSNTTRLYPGDIIAIPESNTNVSPAPGDRTRLVETIEVPGSRWIATMRLGAGLYSDAFGPLPFTAGKVPAERYGIYEGTQLQ
jgi:4-amino-4-deoxy-L-arabinose transferase-like glycosyltransferase